MTITSTGIRLYEYRCAAATCDRRTGGHALMFKGALAPGTAVQVKCWKCRQLNLVIVTSTGGLRSEASTYA